MGTSLHLRHVAITSAILIAAWYVLSGKFDLLHFGTGAVYCVLLALLLPPWRDGLRQRMFALLLYWVWLAWQIFVSNLRVARLVFDPRLPIEPTMLRVRPGVRGARALTTLGASVTLTPGTLTVDVDEQYMLVHSLDARSAQDVREGQIAAKVAGIFREERP